MKTLKQGNIKNLPHYFFNDMISIKNFDPRLLSIDKTSFKSVCDVIYDIEYITIQSLDNGNIDSASSLYLIFNNVDGYNECNSTECNSIEESDENKYLIFASTDKNKEVLKKYTEHWDKIKNQIKTISGGKPIKFGRDFMKIRLESDDDLPLGKILSIPVCVITVGSVFKNDSNYYPQAHLHECLYEYKY